MEHQSTRERISSELFVTALHDAQILRIDRGADGRGEELEFKERMVDMSGLRDRLMLVAALLSATVGCAGVANTTRTGLIHQVKFEERMTPTELWVRSGDEVRWINQRSRPVTVEFLGGALDEVSCESGFSNRGFTNLMASRREEIEIEPNESASLCFTGADAVTYNARMGSAVPGGQTLESGTIHIGR